MKAAGAITDSFIPDAAIKIARKSLPKGSGTSLLLHLTASKRLSLDAALKQTA